MRVLVTGSAQGLGRGAARSLLAAGHEVVVHARDHERSRALADLVGSGAALVVGDLASAREVHRLAEQVDALGDLDAIIHNAGVYGGDRAATPEGHPRTLAVNALAPYLLTGLTRPPARLIFLSSGMHRAGDPRLTDLDWTARRWDWAQAYSDSKLYVTALAFALAHRWPHVRSYAVDPGWVPTRMGGPGAPDDLVDGQATQVWLASTDDVVGSGTYWHHRRERSAAPAARSDVFQDSLIEAFERMTHVALP